MTKGKEIILRAFEDKVIAEGQAVQMDLSCNLDDGFEVLTVVVMIIQAL